MAIKRIPITKSSIGYYRSADKKWFCAGATDYIGVGEGKGQWLGFVSAVFSPSDWADIKEITGAVLVLITPSGASTALSPNLGAPSDNAPTVMTLLNQAFADNTGTTFLDSWTGHLPPSSAGIVLNGIVDNDIDKLNKLDVRAFVQYWAPTNINVVIRGARHPGQNKTNYGIKLTVSDVNKQFVVASEQHNDATVQPYIELSYVSNPAPGSLFLTDPPPVVTQLQDQYFEGDYVPGRDGDRVAHKNVQVYLNSAVTGDITDSGAKAVWTTKVVVASASEAETNHIRVPLPALLRSGTAYKWRAAAQNQRGEWTKWTSLSALTVSTDPPALSQLKPDGSKTFETLNNVVFEALYSDPNSNPLLRYRVQLASSRLPSEWDLADDLLWDTQDLAATNSERTSNRIALPYRGDGLPAGTYSWRIRATDSLGADSAWAYPAANLVVTVGEQPDPGSEDLLTGYQARRNRYRILIKKMGANRGPGATVAVLEDAANVGASEFHNAPGEFFFTLPAIHAQVSVIEPWQVHYALESYRGEGWKEIAAGLIVDFDATDNDVVFYGTDYLGILDLDVDDRFNPDSSIDKEAGLYPNPPGGSKYNQRTITQIVADQLDRAIHHTNSPVGFIGRGSVATMNEKITIWSTFKQRLSFVAGLIDSHRGANLGLRTRLRVRRTNAAGYEFVVDDQPGKNRDNIRLSYGELIQGFRVVPFGDWGTRVFAIGRPSTGTKIVYAPDITGTSPEGTFGRIPKVNMWQDVTDGADLKRRAQLMARTVSKIGKRLALAIRVDVLDVKDGWDIADSVLVDIDRGVVNTDNYGSAYWTIWGWSWQLYPDGHTDLTLSISPRLDDEAPSTDLIDSDPIHITPEWAIGKGKPTATTFALLASRTWVDGDTGEVYDYDTENALWVLSDETVGIEGSPGPPGPPGPAGGGVVQMGEWRWSVTNGTPGSGRFNLPINPPAPGLATFLQIFETDWNNNDRSPYLDAIRIGDSLVIDDNNGNVWQHEVTGAIVDNGTWRSVPIIYDPRATVVLQPAEIVCEMLFIRGVDPTDTVPPAAPTVSAFSSRISTDDDGRKVVALTADITHPTTNADGTAIDDLFGTTVQVTADNDKNPDPLLVKPVWTNPTTMAMIAPDGSHAELPGVAGNTPFWARAQSVDIWGNRGDWSATAFTVSAKDPDAPAVPSGLTAVGGFKSVGCTWSPASAADFNINELRYAADNGTGVAPDATAESWASPLRLKANTIVISGLTPDVKYWLQVRAIDFSGNVATSNTDPTAVDWQANPEAGWSSMVSATPSLIGASDVAFNSVLTNILNTGVINANDILAGTLKVRTSSGVGGIEVYNGDVKVGYWDETGLYVGTTTAGLPTDLSSSSYVRLFDAGLVVYRNGTPQTAITPDGINASAIDFGVLPGGHNLIRNSSFELAAFGTTVPTPKDWTIAADWTATQQSNVNTTNGAAALAITGTTY